MGIYYGVCEKIKLKGKEYIITIYRALGKKI